MKKIIPILLLLCACFSHADTTTARLALTKPTPGGSVNTWAPKLNTDLDLIDAGVALLSSSNTFTSTNTFSNDVKFSNLTGTVGAVPYLGAFGLLSRSSLFVWDATNHMLGVGGSATSTITAHGYIESTQGGFVFPDGSTQATAASSSTGTVMTGGLARSVVFLDTSSRTTTSVNFIFDGSNLSISGLMAGASLSMTGIGSFGGQMTGLKGLQVSGLGTAGIGSGFALLVSTDASTTHLAVAGTGQVQVGNGSLSVPAIGFVNSTGTGIYRVGSNDMGFVSNGLIIADVKPGGDAAGKFVINKMGTASFPSLAFDDTTGLGFYADATNDTLGIATSGSQRILVAGSSTTITGNLIVSGTVSGTTFSGSGASLTALPASQVTGANALPDAVLSTNVSLLNATNAFTGVNTFPAGTGSATYKPEGLLDTLIISSGMAAGSSAETTLYTYTIPANTFVSTATYARQVIHISAGGSTANAATLEEVRVKYGATTIFDSGAAGLGTNNWTLDCDIIQRTTGASQRATCRFTSGTATLVNSNVAATETISSTSVLSITGQVSVATANGVTVDNAYVEKK